MSDVFLGLLLSRGNTNKLIAITDRHTGHLLRKSNQRSILLPCTSLRRYCLRYTWGIPAGKLQQQQRKKH